MNEWPNEKCGCPWEESGEFHDYCRKNRQPVEGLSATIWGRQWGHILSIDNGHLTGRNRAGLDRFACGYATAVSLSSTGATAANVSPLPTTTGAAFPAASPNSLGLEWQKALVRHGDWTRVAVVYVAVRLGGWTLSELRKLG